jgi:hypothetical protein
MAPKCRATANVAKMKSAITTPSARPTPNPPRRGGDQLNGSRSTARSQTSGSTTSQTLDAAKTTLPAASSGHQNMAAAVPRLGTGTSSRRARSAR